MLTNLNVFDVWTHLKVYRAEVPRAAELREDGFGMKENLQRRLREHDIGLRSANLIAVERTGGEEDHMDRWVHGIWYTLRYSVFN